MITLTRELILSARTKKGGFTRTQLELLGVKWPPRTPWLKRLVGTQINDKTWAKVLVSRDGIKLQETPNLPGMNL